MDLTVKKKISDVLSWVALIAWALLIFMLSAQPALQSNGLSRRITEFIIETIDRWITLGLETSTIEDLVSQINSIIRKLAHGGSYFMMGILAVNAFKRTIRLEKRSHILSVAFCILFAISDEVHQLYVPGRSGEVRDVLIDSIGAVLAVIILWGMSVIKRRRV